MRKPMIFKELRTFCRLLTAACRLTYLNRPLMRLYCASLVARPEQLAAFA